jgi:hypothetical protein
MPKRSKVKLYEQLRKAREREGLSIHELARRFGVHRRDVRQAVASARARACGAFGPTHERFWSQARRRLGDRDGTRVLIEVLLLHRSLDATAVVAGMHGALCAGRVDAAVVAIEARRAASAVAPGKAPVLSHWSMTGFHGSIAGDGDGARFFRAGGTGGVPRRGRHPHRRGLSRFDPPKPTTAHYDTLLEAK